MEKEPDTSQGEDAVAKERRRWALDRPKAMQIPQAMTIADVDFGTIAPYEGDDQYSMNYRMVALARGMAPFIATGQLMDYFERITNWITHMCEPLICLLDNGNFRDFSKRFVILLSKMCDAADVCMISVSVQNFFAKIVALLLKRDEPGTPYAMCTRVITRIESLRLLEPDRHAFGAALVSPPSSSRARAVELTQLLADPANRNNGALKLEALDGLRAMVPWNEDGMDIMAPLLLAVDKAHGAGRGDLLLSAACVRWIACATFAHHQSVDIALSFLVKTIDIRNRRLDTPRLMLDITNAWARFVLRHHRFLGPWLQPLLKANTWFRLQGMAERMYSGFCQACDKQDTDANVHTKYCARCKFVKYCSAACQTADYARHEVICRSLANISDMSHTKAHRMEYCRKIMMARREALLDAAEQLGETLEARIKYKRPAPSVLDDYRADEDEDDDGHAGDDLD